VTAYEDLLAAETDDTRPKAFLNFLFFDEDMNLVPEHSRIWQAEGENNWSKIGSAEYALIEMPQNGYIVSYLSNQSEQETWFDNMSVELSPGILLEEQHYYAYGLPIAGLGSLAATATKSRQRYQGNEYIEEQGLDWMDFHNRQYDPQLGRFLSVDPLADAGGQQTLSPYHAMGCNPVTMVDPLGLEYFAPRDNLPSAAIPNAGIAFLGKEMVVFGANALNFAAWQMRADNRFTDFVIESFIRQALGEWKAQSKESAKSGVPGSGSVGGNSQQSESLKGQGVDYVYNRVTISSETKANGLDYNRIVIYETKRKKRGQIKDQVNIGNQVLYNGASDAKHSRYQFMNFGDGAISIWEFLAKHADFEWGLTEYKSNGIVYSRIVSIAEKYSTGPISGGELEKGGIERLTYWVSIHNHPMGGNGLSDAVNERDKGKDDRTSRVRVRAIFPEGEMDAFDHSHLKGGRRFIERFRK